MIEDMKKLALWMLTEESNLSTDDVEGWYSTLRSKSPDKLLPWLVEAPDNSERFYTLSADPNDETASILETHERKESDNFKLPFNQPTGSQSAALGPIIKRTFTAKKTGPSKKIQDTTLKEFSRLGETNLPWSHYFSEAVECFSRSKLRLLGDDACLESGNPSGAFSKAISVIDEKKTVFLCFKDSKNRLPGEVPEYQQYLIDALAKTKYTTLKAPEVLHQTCSLCGTLSSVLPNALRGAGLNFANIDRDGAFPGLDTDQAWKHFSLCGSCSDALYIYFHFIFHNTSLLGLVVNEHWLFLHLSQGSQMEFESLFENFENG